VAVVERDGKVLVIRRHLDGRDYAVLPGGGIEAGESAGEAALRELREECALDGTLGELLHEGPEGGRHASNFRITGVTGDPVLGGEEAGAQDEANQHHPLWAAPQDLRLMGLLPEGLTDLVVQWLWPLRVLAVETPPGWEVVTRLWQLFQHDLAELRGSTPGPDGTFKVGHLASYPLEDPDTVAYVVLQGDRPVGFALVRGLEADERVLGEFFVVRSVRRAGVARSFAERVLHAHPGPWRVAFQDENAIAARFWRRLWSETMADVSEEAREIPGKPYLPPDRWLSGVLG
jgi:predicted acetyltransferase/8-oxo-dGTP pyrophosphatase MutT (NUDIX family)